MRDLTPFEQAQIAGAIRYVKADRSDPFAYNRAVSHVYSGLTRTKANESKNCGYDARLVPEKRTYVDANGEQVTYFVDAWQDRVRP